MLVILSLSIATAAIGTTGFSLVSTVFAGGDHHEDEGKKCKKNDDNNCNDTHKTQKIKSKNECEIENENKDHNPESQDKVCKMQNHQFAQKKKSGREQ